MHENHLRHHAASVVSVPDTGDATLPRLEMPLDGVNGSTVDFADESRDIFVSL